MRSLHLPTDEWEIRRASSTAVDLDDGQVIRGYPIVFNKLSEDLGGFRERILPSAVNRSLSADIRALVDHDTAKVLGRTTSGTLTLKKDATGLRVKIDPDLEISYARDIMRAVQRGDVSGMSFGFRVPPGGDEWHEDGPMPIRDVHDMEIREFSIVTFPAYEATSVEIAKRSLDTYRKARGYQWRTKWHEISDIAR